MAGDSVALSSSTSLLSFASDLPSPAERYLARTLAQTLDENWRTADDFLRYFTARDIMYALAAEHELRASILIGAAGMHPKLAKKKPAESAAEDLELALAEQVTDAARVLELFPVDDRVRFLDVPRLWSFVSEDEVWTAALGDVSHARAVARVACMLECAVQEDLLTLQQITEGLGFAEITASLPPARLADVVRHALELAHTGRVLDEAALLEVVPLSELLERIPLEHVFRTIIVERIAAPAGWIAPPRASSQSVVPRLVDPVDDDELESAFAALQSTPPPVQKPTQQPSISTLASEEIHVEIDVSEPVPAKAPLPIERPPHEEEARQRVCARLSRMDRLPPGHEALSLPILLSIESMYAELLTLSDDAAREQCIRDSFPNEHHLRTAMLALIELLAPTIETRRKTVKDTDIESLIAVVLFEERHRHERKTATPSTAAVPTATRNPPAAPPPLPVRGAPPPLPAARSSSSIPPASGARPLRALLTPPPPLAQKR